MTPEEALDILRDRGNETLLLEPREQFDSCIIGVAERFNSAFAVYDRAKVLEALAEDSGSDEDALDHYYFNVLGGWVGEGTPAFLLEL